ncbi:hypothetical protein ACUH97_04190 [Dermabacteraceae bacterium P13088]
MEFYIIAFLNFLAVCATIASAVLSAKALATARDANKNANRAHLENQEIEKERDLREQERERRLIAGTLQAWWACHEEVVNGEIKRRWGVVISNEGSVSSVFHDIQIDVTFSLSSDNCPVSILTMPPGLYFVQRNVNGKGENAGHPWKLPEKVSDSSNYHPITKGKNHSVDAISFTDQLGAHWKWDARNGLSSHK